MITEQQQSKLRLYFANQPVDAVYIFGSVATGKNTSLSDVDIAILFDSQMSKSQRADYKIQFSADLDSIFPDKNIDLVDLANAPIALKFSAIFPRQTIVIKNRNRMVLFEADTMSRYFDYQYFINQNTQQGLNAFANYGRN